MDDHVVAGMRHVGIREEDIQAALATQASELERAGQPLEGGEDYEVHEDAWEGWLFFLRVQSQWLYKTAGWISMGAMQFETRRSGLNRAGVESTARLGGYPRSTWPQLLADIEVIERAILDADAGLPAN